MLRRSVLTLLAASAVAGLLLAQKADEPAGPDEAKLKLIQERTDKLGDVLQSLRKRKVPDHFLVDIEVYHKAATYILRHKEFPAKDNGDATLDALDRGMLRASQISRAETPWFMESGHAVVHGYRSRIDDSVQPYAVTFPANYGKERRNPWRLDVVLHGRDNTLTEVKFLAAHTDKKAAAKDQDFVQLDIYGRGNNAYRWAGESDVFEAIEAFLTTERLAGREFMLDPNKVVLRGFSMGGAGSWHLGLHHPGRWAVVGPGAGFTTTKGYAPDLPNPMPAYQEKCLHIYDALDYAENAFNVPIVAYSGANDKQMEAARNIEEKLKTLGISMTHLVAPGLGHQFPPEWQAKAEAEYRKHTAKGKPEYPPHVRFVTWTLKYPLCDWVEIGGLDEHYNRALVDAEKKEGGYTIKTENVRVLHISLEPAAMRAPTKVAIDGQTLEPIPYLNRAGEVHLYFEKTDGKWKDVLPEKLYTDGLRKLQKSQFLRGPIDDAFMNSFLLVRGTEKPWHEGVQKHAEASLKRFRDEWDKWFRGELYVKDDVSVTPDDIASKHLILFGDPASNSLIAHVIDGLPIKWDREKITLGDKTYASADHVPVLIYPSPLNPNRYIVLNSGHTFHAPDFLATNAMLFPRLGDYAILKVTDAGKDPLAVEVATAGLFDDRWQLPRK